MVKIIVRLLLALFAFELVGVSLGSIGIEPTGYKFYWNAEPFDTRMPYADIDPLVGVWHQPNDSWVQRGACFSAMGYSNKWGAGDNNWDTTQTGYAFAGSSFVEGYGVNYGERFSEDFERLSGKEVFNLGMAGTFSPVQYYMALKKFENTLKFDTCFVFLLVPGDEVLLSEVDEDRYRPYWRNDSIVYQKNTSFKAQKTFITTLKQIVLQYSYLNHLLEYFQNRNTMKAALLVAEGSDQKKTETPTPHLREINKLFCEGFPDKFFYFVILPTMSSGKNDQEFSFNKQYDNSTLFDMRNSVINRSNFFICNPHLNKKGNQVFAEQLYQSFTRFNNAK